MIEATPAYRVLTSRDSLAGADGLSSINTHPLNQGAMVLAAGAIYRLDRNSTATPDGISVITPLAGPGRWLFVASGGNSISVANVATLQLLAASSPSMVWVESLRCYWHRYAGSTATPDGITVVPAIGGGNWERMLETTSKSWLYQVTWYITSATGDDENPGTQAMPLRTAAELARRWGPDPTYPQQITTYITGDLADIIRVKGHVTEYNYPIFRGVPTPVVAGTLTGVQLFNQGAGLIQTITSPALVGVSLGYNSRIRFTYGPIGTIGFPFALDAPAAGEVGLSLIADITAMPNLITWIENTPNIADEFVLETLPRVLGIEVDVVNDLNLNGISLLDTATVFCEGLAFMSVFGSRSQLSFRKNDPLPVVGGARATLFGCTVNVPVVGGAVQLLTCSVGTGGYGESQQELGFENTAVKLVGCLCNAQSNSFRGTFVDIIKSTVVMGSGLWVDDGSILRGGFIGVQWNLSAIVVGETSQVVFGEYSEPTWGAAAAPLHPNSLGVKIVGHGWYVTTAPTITGQLGDAEIGGTARTWLQIPYIEPTNNAMLVLRPAI